MSSARSHVVASTPAPAARAARADEAPLARVANALGYQVVWITAVAGAGAGAAWPGAAAALGFTALTLSLGGRWRNDLRTLAIALPLGFMLDSAFGASGWMAYAQAWPAPLHWVAPLWIWALWTAFAMTLNHSLCFLCGRPALSALLGAIGGPLAYWSAAGAFDAVDFRVPPARPMLALALAWGVLLPVLVAANARVSAGQARRSTGLPA